MTYITSHLNLNANIKFDDGKRLHASKKEKKLTVVSPKQKDILDHFKMENRNDGGAEKKTQHL